MHSTSLRISYTAKLPAVFLACALLSIASSVHAQRGAIRIMVEDAAEPWSYPDGSGYANEVVLAAFQAVDVPVKLEVVPYSRCKSQVLSAAVPACFSMGWLPEFNGVLRFSTKPLFKVNADVFEHVEHPIPRKLNAECKFEKDMRLGITRGYEYPEEILGLSKEGVVFVEAVTDQNSLKMLAAKRFSAAIIMTNDFEPKSRKIQLSDTGDKVRFAFNCGVQLGSIGFSLKHPQGITLLAKFESGFQKIEANGTLKKNQARWFDL
ncbi:substrate-binding periplasmic protein [Undibacterium flavidum]|uniref:ABC transporter substrate-binding protein n=1 Tax=Undibacterium flavidum TaxID=2762297 RepID=A0ABR6YC33_9BURK|nr:ABC transporter substrate-binding protein [Undibacterium flavidum]MBC3874096.1 ABC transporter substrate-binding protein [Undibacterium flavidum]